MRKLLILFVFASSLLAWGCQEENIEQPDNLITESRAKKLWPCKIFTTMSIPRCLPICGMN